MRIFLLCLSALLASLASAQDKRDQEIFGGATPTTTPEAYQRGRLKDTLEIGGRFELRGQSAQSETQTFAEAAYSDLKRVDMYFDTRPDKDIRGLARLRLSEAKAAGETTTKTEIDEMWFKWSASDAVFFTLGKQHLKWGAASLWNPTDFTAVTQRDPFTLFDSRLGQDLFKVHLPFEKQGFNTYAIFQYGSMRRNDDIGVALRGEFQLGSSAEASVSFQTSQDMPIRWGADISGAIGPVDAYCESALTRRESRRFYRGAFDPEHGVLPASVNREHETFSSTVFGIRYDYKYSDEDAATFGVEYFANGLGYHDRELELYGLIMQDAKPLYAADRYAGAYVRLPEPGSFNQTAVYMFGMKNLADESAVARVTVTHELKRLLTLEVFASHCLGDYGELCFRIPEKFRKLAAYPGLNPDQQKALSSLPTERTREVYGAAASLNF